MQTSNPLIYLFKVEGSIACSEVANGFAFYFGNVYIRHSSTIEQYKSSIHDNIICLNEMNAKEVEIAIDQLTNFAIGRDGVFRVISFKAVLSIW